VKTPDNVRESVHVKILKGTKMELRIIGFRRKLTMQEMFEEFAQRIVTGDQFALEILDDIQERKKNKKKRDLNVSDKKALFDIIEDANSDD